MGFHADIVILHDIDIVSLELKHDPAISWGFLSGRHSSSTR